jgi:hypothetical protein
MSYISFIRNTSGCLALKKKNKPLALEMEHLSPYGPCWGTQRGAHFPGTLKERQIIWGVCSLGTLRDSWRRALETEHLSLWALCEGNLERGLLYWGPWRMCKGKLWRWASLFIGAPVGNLEGGLYTGDFERWMKEGARSGASLSEGALWGKPWGRAPLLGTPKDTLIKALEMGVCFHRGPPFWETWRDTPFLMPLREGKKNSLFKEIFMRNLRDM